MEETILIVDEDPATRRALREALRPEGYVVRQAASALDAMLTAANSAKPFDLALIEVGMQGIDGLKLGDKLVQAFPATRVIYLAGQGSSELHDSLVLSKPVEPVELLKAVRQALASSMPRKGPSQQRRAGLTDRTG